MKAVSIILLFLFGVLMMYMVFHLPAYRDSDAPIHCQHSPAGTPAASAYYIEHAQLDANTPNMVTVILADYRGYDTLGETVVIYTAGLICLLMLRRERE
jgi:multicomponent Na+:H+ antiporter subunit B